MAKRPNKRKPSDEGEPMPEQEDAEEGRPRLAIRLAELLNYPPHSGGRPGIIRDIVKHTGLDRHQVAALLKNKAKYLPLDTLFRLYEYLIEKKGIPAQQLLGALFAFQPQDFWELLARRRKIDFCMAVRQPEKSDWADGALVVASDAQLMGELLKGLAKAGGTANSNSAPQAAASEGAGAAAGNALHPEVILQSLVWAPRRDTSEVDIELAHSVYTPFATLEGDKALVCLGSNKSNPVFELIVAGVFGCKPFVSESDVAEPRYRSAPFFIAYRENDPQPVSCVAGRTLARGQPVAAPGIWYETEEGNWELCPWTETDNDVAIVFYRYSIGTGKLEMVLGGFSGRATRLLAKTLKDDAGKFWPPAYCVNGVQIGAFIVQYKFIKHDFAQRDILRTELHVTETVIPLATRVIADRLARRGPGDELDIPQPPPKPR